VKIETPKAEDLEIATPDVVSELMASDLPDEGDVELELDSNIPLGETIQGSSFYQTTDFSEFFDRINPGEFYDEGYDATLIHLIGLTLKVEAPIADDLLVQRIARAHDFKRAGRIIRERVLALVDDHFHLRQDPVGGCFVWLHEGGPSTMMSFRLPVEGEVVRSIEEIPAEEILAATKHAGRSCSPVQIARIFGNKRLTTQGKDRIERAIQLLGKP
jgi:hypothetical protein